MYWWILYLELVKKWNSSEYIYKKILRKLLRKPITIEYSQYSQYLLNNYIVNENVYPSICPNYDHSPRSKFRGTIIVNSTPQKWKKLCHEMFSKVSVRSAEDNLVFIKAWNEWGKEIIWNQI